MSYEVKSKQALTSGSKVSQRVETRRAVFYLRGDHEMLPLNVAQTVWMSVLVLTSVSCKHLPGFRTGCAGGMPGQRAYGGMENSRVRTVSVTRTDIPT